MIDIAECAEARRAALTNEERAAEDRLKAEQLYHFACYSHYDATGELPAPDPPPNPIGEHFTRGLIARLRERGLGPCKPPPPAPVTAPLTHAEQVAMELARLLADQEAAERRRVALTPAERAAEDRAWDAEPQQSIARHEHEKRTLLTVRRAGDETIHSLSRAALAARGFQPLFTLRHDTEDVYFEADDGAWYRIEAYPEYVRSGTPPPAYFAAPPWEPERSPFMEAVLRYRAIIQEPDR